MKPSSTNSALPLRLAQPRYKLAHGLLALSVVLTFGCSKPAPPEVKPTYTEAQKRFEKKCREEFELQVITRQVGQTLYIYLPTKNPMFDYEAQKENADAATAEKKQKFAIQYLDVAYKNRSFNLEYDIVDKKKSSKDDYGYSSAYTDSYSKEQNNMFTAISDTFFGAKAQNDEKEPKFFVIIITDIKKGIETRATFYLEDFKRYMAGDLPYDEYMKRFLADTKGGQSLIGDEIGSHIEFKDIQMPDFLAKQISNRVNFKFQRSDFQPGDDYDNAIVDIVADTTRYYRFEDYNEVRVNNLRTTKKFIFNKVQLVNFGDDKPQDKGTNPPGKLIHIIFENGEAKIQEPIDNSIK